MPDLFFLIANFTAIIHFRQIFVMIHHRCKPLDMDKTVAVSSRNFWIDLRNNVFSSVHSTSGDIYGNTKGTISMGIRRRDLYQGHINRHLFAEKIRDIAQEYRDEIGTSFGHSSSDRRRDKHAINVKNIFILRLIQFYITLD